MGDLRDPLSTSQATLTYTENPVPTCFKKYTTILVAEKIHAAACLNDYCSVTLTSVIMKCFKSLVMGHISSEAALIPHLLAQQVLAPHLCNWIVDFLTHGLQSVRIGDHTIILNIGAPQVCVLCPLLVSLYTRDCVAKLRPNSIYKFADDITIVGWVSNNDTTEYRKEIACFVSWCTDNNLSLNIGKTMELIIDSRKWSGWHAPACINGAEVEMVKSIKFLGVMITNNLSWTIHVDIMVKKVQQCLYILRRLRKFG
eukprot:g35214.t1